MPRPELPTGTVTLLFTDVEGSTRLLREHGETYTDLLAWQRATIRAAAVAHGGVEVDTQGDALFVVFARAGDAIAAADDMQRALADGPVDVRIGMHTGEPLLTDEGYVGLDVHRAARIAAVGHGGQVLLSHATRQLVAAAVRDLGEHRLKDLPAVERIWQLGNGSFPPIRTVANANLPVPVTPLVGRASELEEIGALLRRGDVRLLTLAGPGGSGKTRLALQAAAEIAPDVRDGVWWVPLAVVDDARVVPDAVARALHAQRPVAEHVGAREMVLLLDNFEHVLDAAVAVGGWLAACPHLRVLVTSREPTHLDGEWQYRVDPMSEDDAVALFSQRAAAVEPGVDGDAAVPAICRRVDCLPLAIELAAARVGVLPPGALLERLERRIPVLGPGRRDAPGRHRTLQATIAWSHDLLQPEEQRLLARLAVFAGGGTLDAAEDICDADLDTLGSLVDKSLVRRSGDRYRMLETIREFAAARLADSGEEEDVRGRHADWFAALAERSRSGLRGPGAPAWAERIEREHANIRTAIGWALRADPGTACRLAAAIWSFWLVRGHWAEGARWLDAALASGSPAPDGTLLELRWGAALLHMWHGDGAAATARAAELAAWSEERRSRRGAAVARHIEGLLATDAGDFERALALNEDAAVLAREVGDRWLLGIVMNNAGDALMQAGDLRGARERFEQCIGLADGFRRPLVVTNLAFTRLGEGDRTSARRLCEEALTEARATGFRNGVVSGLLGLGIAVAADEPHRAVALIGAADALMEDAGGSHDAIERRLRDDAMAAAANALGADGSARAYAEGRAWSPADALVEALDRGTTTR